MNYLIELLLCMIGGYFVGSIPTGYIIGSLRGINIQQYGSGTIGATNVGRILGCYYFVLVLLLDSGKSCLYLYTMQVMHPGIDSWLLLVGAIGLLLGNTRSCFLRFSGGKGIATMASILMMFDTVVVFILMLWWFCILLVTRTVGMASVFAAICLPLVWYFIRGYDIFFWWSIIASIWCVWLHKVNIRTFLRS